MFGFKRPVIRPITPIPPSNDVSPYIYIFVRQDISIAQQLVQSNHATWEASRRFTNDFPIANMILIGVPTGSDLQDVAIHLMKNQIRFVPFFEPDNRMGLSAITTEVLRNVGYSRQRDCLKEYELWRPENTNVSEV